MSNLNAALASITTARQVANGLTAREVMDILDTVAVNAVEAGATKAQVWAAWKAGK